MATPTRKTIPKKTREAVWKKDCGDSTTGKCFCCSDTVTALGSWHAGHIIAQANGGPDTAENLRVVCRACNLAMGTENMDAFKARCYPPPIVDPRQKHYESLVMPLDKLNRILGKR
jgi:5-methylcytosine-specific restriction endonuclease McrA